MHKKPQDRASHPLPNTSGFSVFELLICLMVMLQLIGYGAGYLRYQSDDQQSGAAASQIKRLNTAATNYVQDHFSDMVTKTAGNTEALVDLQALINEQYWSAHDPLNNNYNQTYVIKVKQEPMVASHRAVLRLLIHTKEGKKLNERLLRLIASHIGGAGGYLSPRDPTSWVGNAQGWKLPATDTTTQTTGHFAILTYLDERDMLAADTFLRRSKIDGQPQLNSMETDLTVKGASGILFDGDELKIYKDKIVFKNGLELTKDKIAFHTGLTLDKDKIQFHSAGDPALTLDEGRITFHNISYPAGKGVYFETGNCLTENNLHFQRSLSVLDINSDLIKFEGGVRIAPDTISMKDGEDNTEINPHGFFFSDGKCDCKMTSGYFVAANHNNGMQCVLDSSRVYLVDGGYRGTLTAGACSVGCGYAEAGLHLTTRGGRGSVTRGEVFAYGDGHTSYFRGHDSTVHVD